MCAAAARRLDAPVFEGAGNTEQGGDAGALDVADDGDAVHRPDASNRLGCDRGAKLYAPRLCGEVDAVVRYS